MLTLLGLPFLWWLDGVLHHRDHPLLAGFRRYVCAWRDLLDPTAPGPF